MGEKGDDWKDVELNSSRTEAMPNRAENKFSDLGPYSRRLRKSIFFRNNIFCNLR